MKRALSILGVIGVTALITYLAVTRQMEQERTSRLDRALLDAEARLIQLEADIDAAKRRLTELTEARQVSRPPAPPSRQASAAAHPEEPKAPRTANGMTTEAAAPAVAPDVVTVVPVTAGGSYIRYAAFSRPGLTNFVRIEGTSTIHDWQVESRLIGGSAELGPGLATQTEAQVPAGPVDAKVNVFIPVRSLKSVQKDGSPYSDKMNELMYAKLREKSYQRITYTLTSLTPKERPPEMAGPYQYDATGNLGVAGVTNVITMPVAVSPDPSGTVQIAGSVKVKMTDFKITPPSPSLGGAPGKTGDEVTLSFVWWVNPISTGQAAK